MLKSPNISKHLFVFVSANIRERQKEIERNYSALHGKVTDGSREREKREYSEVIAQTYNSDLQLYFYISTLPLFKSFVLVFEQKEPMVYRLHDELKETLKSFLACFLKIEKVKSISIKKKCSE